MQYPKKIETVHVEILDGELCIYDWQRMEVHNLNPTAATVWQLCDGQTSPQQIAGRLRSNLTPAQAEELVWLTLKRLEKANLLEHEVVEPAGRKVYTRREMLARLGVAAAMLPVISSIVAPGPVEAQSPQPGQPPTSGSQTFNYTGAAQTFTVPTGVTVVTIEAWGAQGGNYPLGFGGANGGYVTATLNVTSGETLQVYVGGQGSDGSLSFGGGGGWNGGTDGGDSTVNSGGGGGGGASDVRQGCSTLGCRVIVAGGGGGGGSDLTDGGVGGGTTGAAGDNDDGNGGGGGTQASGGAGGAGGAGAGIGGAGVFGSGGVGGSNGSSTAGGGGGGGGYYGGGGGGGGDDAGGGGGGSSYTAPGATGVMHTQGARTGNGQVVISW